MIKVLIVDDQEMIRESLGLMLNSRINIDVIGSAEDGQEAIEKARKGKPDVILMDVRMPNMNGIDCMKSIKAVQPKTKVIILTTFDDDEYIYESLKHGADGFLLKGASINELVNAIELINAGGSIVDAGVSSKVISLFKKMAKADFLFNVEKEDYDDLADNEVKIIQAIGRGLSNKEIAKHLNFTEGTVRNYISSILKKMDLRDRTQIAIFAIQSSIMLRTFDE